MKNTGKSVLLQRLALLGLLVSTCGIASANLFTNGSFNAGFAGWNAVNTPNGVGAPGTISPFDMDGTGPQIPTPAARFVAGQMNVGPGQGGVNLGQLVTLQPLTEYSISCDTASVCPTNNPDGGKIELLVNNLVVDQVEFGFLAPNQPKLRRLQGNFNTATGGNFVVGARITRNSVPEAVNPVNLFVDNFVASPRIHIEPSRFDVIEGFPLFGGLAALVRPDDICLGIMPDSESLAAAVIISGDSPVGQPAEMTFTLDSIIARRGIIQEIHLRNFQMNNWVPFNGRLMPGGEMVHSTIVVNNAVGNFIGLNGRVEARVRWHPLNDEDPATDGWVHCIDFAHWTVVE